MDSFPRFRRFSSRLIGRGACFIRVDYILRILLVISNFVFQGGSMNVQGPSVERHQAWDPLEKYPPHLVWHSSKRATVTESTLKMKLQILILERLDKDDNANFFIQLAIQKSDLSLCPQFGCIYEYFWQCRTYIRATWSASMSMKSESVTWNEPSASCVLTYAYECPSDHTAKV